jgi:hypothetical protein
VLASGLSTKAELGTTPPQIQEDVVVGRGLHSRSLEMVAPAVAAQWHAIKNGATTPSDVVANSHKKFWFKCDAGPDHEWETTLNNRVSGGAGCPCCAGHKLSVTNSLATVAPDVAEQWHATKNGATTPADVVANSGKNVWITYGAAALLARAPLRAGPRRLALADGSSGACASYHRVLACGLSTKAELGTTPPQIQEDVVIGRGLHSRSLGVVAPGMAAQWHAIKNSAAAAPADVVKNSNKKFWFKCDMGPDHEWKATLNSRVSGGNGCPYCAGQKLSVTNSLATVAPAVAAQWHATKNGATTPADVVAGSTKKFWFTCEAGPDHEWESTVSNRVSRGRGCPCCDGKKLSVTNSLATVAPAVAAQWHATKNGATTPADVVAGSKKKFWFTCDAGPDHEWESTLNNRVSGGQGCPCCVNQKVSVTNSLASLKPAAAAMWDHEANSPLTPSDVIAGSHKVYGFVDGGGRPFERALKQFKRTGSFNHAAQSPAADKVTVLVLEHYSRLSSL